MHNINKARKFKRFPTDKSDDRSSEVIFSICISNLCAISLNVELGLDAAWNAKSISFVKLIRKVVWTYLYWMERSHNMKMKHAQLKQDERRLLIFTNCPGQWKIQSLNSSFEWLSMESQICDKTVSFITRSNSRSHFSTWPRAFTVDITCVNSTSSPWNFKRERKKRIYH